MVSSSNEVIQYLEMSEALQAAIRAMEVALIAHETIVSPASWIDGAQHSEIGRSLENCIGTMNDSLETIEDMLSDAPISSNG